MPVFALRLEPDVDEGCLCPSTVAVKEGALWFGSQAERHGGQLFRQLKVKVAHDVEMRAAAASPIASREGHAQGDSPDLLADGARVTAEELATLFLAWAMGAAASALPAELLPNGTQPALSCSVGLPIDQEDGASPLRRAFERMAAIAWRLRFAVKQGVAVDAGIGWVRSHAIDIKEPAVLVCPEAMAAVTSYLTSAGAALGMYALVDIGAWTTDISMFRLSDVSVSTEGIRTAAIYEARTIRAAAGRIDGLTHDLHLAYWRDLCLAAPGEREPLLAIFRQARERGEPPSPVLRDGTPAPVVVEALDYARRHVAGVVAARFARLHAAAIHKETKLTRFDVQGFDMLLLGGGSAESSFRIGLETLAVEQRPRSVTLAPCNDSLRLPEGATAQRIAHRLQVAAGLAVPYALWPKLFRPSEVDRPMAAVAGGAARREWDLNTYD